MTTNDSEQIYAAVRDRYADAARAASNCSCCGPSDTATEFAGRRLYEADEIDALPSDAVAASLGCGNPTMLADLQPGEVVLDLGSGGGIDVLLSARRVGPDGMAYGLDMTPEMLDLARKNQAESGLANVEFLQGTIEDIPLPDWDGRRRDLQLRCESVAGQGGRVARGVSSAQARWTVGNCRHRAAPWSV